MKTIIHVNRHHIAHNKKKGSTKKPVFAVKDYKQNRKTQEVVITGPCRLIYRPDNPLPCGATVWIETKTKVLTMSETGYYTE